VAGEKGKLMPSVKSIDELSSRIKNDATEKEMSFLSSAQRWLASRGSLTPGQEGWLLSISEKYSDEAILERQKWDNNWSDEHRKIAIRVARYYEANPPYYSALVAKILANCEKFVLSKKEWNKFCENKFAKKIRNEYESKPKFEKGDCIQIRKTNKIRKANYTKAIPAWPGDKFGFVLVVDAKPIVRAAKGSRIYQILLTGYPQPLYVHESDIKKPRKTNVKN